MNSGPHHKSTRVWDSNNEHSFLSFLELKSPWPLQITGAWRELSSWFSVVSHCVLTAREWRWGGRGLLIGTLIPA